MNWLIVRISSEYLLYYYIVIIFITPVVHTHTGITHNSFIAFVRYHYKTIIVVYTRTVK